MNDVLLLNADYSPVRVVDWRRAVCLLLDDKVRRVADYADLQIRSARASVPWPAVVTLTRYSRHLCRARFNRTNVLARDAWTCQYCGDAPRTPSGSPRTADLTLDHVVPRSRATNGRVRLPWSGESVPVTGWHNVVAACRPCNQTKAARTPAEAHMDLARRPTRPTPWEATQLFFARQSVPDEWKTYLHL